jgi:hypothetical protein
MGKGPGVTGHAEELHLCRTARAAGQGWQGKTPMLASPPAGVPANVQGQPASKGHDRQHPGNKCSGAVGSEMAQSPDEEDPLALPPTPHKAAALSK